MGSDAQALLEDLKDADVNVRQVATEALWRLWYTQKRGLWGTAIGSQPKLDGSGPNRRSGNHPD